LRDEDALLAVLVRASASETRLAEEYALRRRAKEELRLRRAARDQMYSERRDKDCQEELARQAEEVRRLHAENAEQVGAFLAIVYKFPELTQTNGKVGAGATALA
jgi:hypothetical protein